MRRRAAIAAASRTTSQPGPSRPAGSSRTPASVAGRGAAASASAPVTGQRRPDRLRSSAANASVRNAPGDSTAKPSGYSADAARQLGGRFPLGHRTGRRVPRRELQQMRRVAADLAAEPGTGEPQVVVGRVLRRRQSRPPG